MSKYTIKEKYEFLLSKLDVHNIDCWEQDALVGIPSIYFQFEIFEGLDNKDNLVEMLMEQS